jgi:hypothetical protein
MCVNTQVQHHRGVEEKEEEEPPERSLEAPQEEAAAEAGPAKAGPTPAKASLNPGYSRPARVSYVWAMKPPMLSIFPSDQTTPSSWLPIYMAPPPLEIR